ncbi:hypothetical protein EBGED10_59290 [Bacillus sp. GeD10]|nr:hypothetical protein EBGED10_59290 [Bacillus sp. GeD10]
MRPFGYPPTPNALSNPTEPLDTTDTFCSGRSPSFIIAPVPNSFTIFFRASSNAFSFP